MSTRNIYLFVDDSRVSRMKIRQIAAQSHPDWELLEAASGQQAHDMTCTVTPDLISMDINMPGMSGIEAIEGLRKNCPNAKIVLLSGTFRTTCAPAPRRLDSALSKSRSRLHRWPR